MRAEFVMSDQDKRDLAAMVVKGLLSHKLPGDPQPVEPEVVTIPAEGFISEAQFIQVMGIGKTTLWDQINAGVYPRPYKLSANRNGWAVDEVRALIERIKQSRLTAVKSRVPVRKRGS